MAFFDFFWKEVKNYSDTTAQNVISEVNEGLEEISERLRKVETKQKETSIQLEELDDFLQSGGEKTALVEALIALIDIIGDFYFFAAQDAGSPLFEQAQMMWNTANSTARSTGLEVINAANEPVNFYLHTIESAEQNDNMPNGYVIKTLKYGYIYQNEIIRRAIVIVNRSDTLNKEGT